MAPLIGSVWRHRQNRGLYVIYDITNLLQGKLNFPCRVVYMDVNGNTFSRELTEWQERFDELTTLTTAERETIATCVKAVAGAKDLLHAHFLTLARARP